MSRTVNVWWLNADPGTPSRGFWDQQLLEELLQGAIWDHGLDFVHHVGVDEKPTGGAVVVLPARSQRSHVDTINRLLAGLTWALVVVCGDEERVFPWLDLRHPRMRVWVQSPNVALDNGADGFLPVGWSPGVREVRQWQPERRDVSWAFMGQVTHQRRVDCAEALRKIGDRFGPGCLVESAGFTQGLPKDEYLRLMRRTKVAPCPSGPVTVDTFRLWEALELGCVPIVDDRTPLGDDEAYWHLMFDEQPPFPSITYWSGVGTHIIGVLGAWDTYQLQTQAWWGRYKRRLVEEFCRQVRDLAGIADEVDDSITVVITTSPIPSHPAAYVLAKTVNSVREHLPRAAIVVAADGVRAEQRHMADDYTRFLQRVVVEGIWRNVVFDIGITHMHQALTVKRALRHVRTPTVLLMEHDTPFSDEPIDWRGCYEAVFHGDANVIRFHHEADVHPEHRWLMVDLERKLVRGVPLMQTMQWSQRPHLAETGFYRKMLNAYFGSSSRTMIEDTMHGVLDHAWREHGHAGAATWKCFLYAPEGSMRRTLHTDGREHEPKYDMAFEYPDNDHVPEGAPYPTSRRTD